MTPARRPPAAIRKLLLRLLPKGLRGASIVADLDEDYRRLGGGVRRDVWYGWEALRLVWHYRFLDAGHRLGDGWSSRMNGGAEGMMRSVIRNLAYGVRRLRRDPGLGVVGVGTIGLGIGATVAIFTVVNAVLLEPLPYERPETLVALFEADLARDVDRNVANAGNARAWQEQTSAIEELAGIVMPQPVVLEGAGDPQEVVAAHVTPNFFGLLGMEMRLGRSMSPDAGGTGSAELVLSHGFWSGTFGADPEVLGRTVQVNGTSYEIVGVLPPGYVAFGDEAEFYRSVPLEQMGDQTNSGRFLWVVGRVSEGVTPTRLQEELDAVSRNLQEAYPDFNAGWTVRAVPLQQDVIGDTAVGLWVLLGSVGVLLLIACANVANLFLSRATERRREMAVRTSLGASAADLFRQLVSESLVVAVAGGALGLGLAYAGTTLLAQRMPAAFALPRVADAGIDGRVLLFATGVTLLTGFLFGVVPAIEAKRTMPARTLNAEGRGPSRTTGRLRNLLVVAEVALSLVLLVSAGLLIRSFTSLLAVDTGIAKEGVLTARLNLATERYRDPSARARFFDRTVERLSQEPGVVAVGGNTFLPMVGLGSATSFRDFDAPAPPPEDWPVMDVRNVTGDYFGAMEIELIAGRSFESTDRAGTTQVLVVNRTLTDQMWPGEDPIGKRLAINWGSLDEPWEVVGVVEDVRLAGPDSDPRPIGYHHYRQAPYFPFMHLTLRTGGDPARLVPVVRSVVAEIDPGVPLGQPRLMDDWIGDAVARPRMTTFLMGLFALVAATLATVGLYGVLSYAVTCRVREIGLRMAIGADRGRVLGMVVRQGMTLVLGGLLLGGVAAAFSGRLLTSLLFGIAPGDPASFLGAMVLLAGAALAACFVPAWRATRVAPAEALREG